MILKYEKKQPSIALKYNFPKIHKINIYDDMHL